MGEEDLGDIVSQYPATLFFNGYLPEDLDSRFSSTYGAIFGGVHIDNPIGEFSVEKPTNLAEAIMTAMYDVFPETVSEEVPLPKKVIESKEDVEVLSKFFTTNPIGQLKDILKEPLTLGAVLEHLPSITLNNEKLKDALIANEEFLDYRYKSHELTLVGRKYVAKRNIYPHRYAVINMGESLYTPHRQSHFVLRDMRLRQDYDELTHATKKLGYFAETFDTVIQNPVDQHSILNIRYALAHDFIQTFEKDLASYLVESGLKIEVRPIQEKYPALFANNPFPKLLEFMIDQQKKKYTSDKADYLVTTWRLYEQAFMMGNVQEAVTLFRNVEHAYSVFLKELEDPLEYYKDIIPMETFLQRTRNEYEQTKEYEPPKFSYEFADGDSDSWLFNNHLDNLLDL